MTADKTPLQLRLEAMDQACELMQLYEISAKELVPLGHPKSSPWAKKRREAILQARSIMMLWNIRPDELQSQSEMQRWRAWRVRIGTTLRQLAASSGTRQGDLEAMRIRPRTQDAKMVVAWPFPVAEADQEGPEAPPAPD